MSLHDGQWSLHDSCLSQQSLAAATALTNAQAASWSYQDLVDTWRFLLGLGQVTFPQLVDPIGFQT